MRSDHLSMNKVYYVYYDLTLQADEKQSRKLPAVSKIITVSDIG